MQSIKKIFKKCLTPPLKGVIIKSRNERGKATRRGKAHSCRSKTKPTKTPDRMEPSDAVYKCEPSRKATSGHHAAVLGNGVAQQDAESYKSTGERLSFFIAGPSWYASPRDGPGLSTVIILAFFTKKKAKFYAKFFS